MTELPQPFEEGMVFVCTDCGTLRSVASAAHIKSPDYETLPEVVEMEPACPCGNVMFEDFWGDGDE